MTKMIILINHQGMYKKQDLKIHGITFSVIFYIELCTQREASNKGKTGHQSIFWYKGKVLL